MKGKKLMSEGRTEDGVYDVICFFDSVGKVFGEGDREGFELGC